MGRRKQAAAIDPDRPDEMAERLDDEIDIDAADIADPTARDDTAHGSSSP
jgi:hypothetical protein